MKKTGRTEKQLKTCTSCGLSKELIKNYFISNSHYNNDKRETICKECLKKDLDYDNIQTVKDILLRLNRPFIYSLWLSTVEETKNSKTFTNDPLGSYMKNLHLAYKDLTWKDSDDTDHIKTNMNITISDETTKDPIVEIVSSFDQQNKADVIRMVGYDPFEFETESDKRHLYNKLVDFLDESTLEDSFKLPAVIEIVKTFNQVDKINSALSLISSNTKSVTENVGGIKSLIDAKEKMLKSVLALAKDNGISVNHNNNKSKGTGTLSGIIKQLNEKNIEAAEINVYDVETCEGMRQVADISNKSILDQLMLNENDYTEMINDQRELILNYGNRLLQLEEELRLTKIRLKQYEQNEI